MNLTKKRWLVLVASCIVNICIGTGFAWSVYQTGLSNEAVQIFGHEVPLSQLALAFTICSGVAPIPMIAGSGLQKKLHGPRNVIWLGGILFGLGLVATSFVHSLGMLYVTYGLLCGFGIAFAYGITIGNTVKFFPDKRGLVAGISTAAYGAGSIIFPPIMAGFDRLCWRAVHLPHSGYCLHRGHPGRRLLRFGAPGRLGARWLDPPCTQG